MIIKYNYFVKHMNIVTYMYLSNCMSICGQNPTIRRVNENKIKIFITKI